MKVILNIILLHFLIACSGINFVYENEKNLVNPLYQKTNVSTSGVDINFLNSYLPMFFGNNNKNIYDLFINIDEKKTKRSVETNQATSNLRYELRFIYTLKLNVKGCVTYKKEVASYFSVSPKSSGYNYGTDTSLEKKYELAITENLNQFLSILSDIDVNACL